MLGLFIIAASYGAAAAENFLISTELPTYVALLCVALTLISALPLLVDALLHSIRGPYASAGAAGLEPEPWGSFDIVVKAEAQQQRRPIRVLGGFGISRSALAMTVLAYGLTACISLVRLGVLRLPIAAS